MRNAVKIISVHFLIIANSLALEGQVQLGVKFGISTYDLRSKNLILRDQLGQTGLSLTIDGTNYGVFGGLMLLLYFGNFYIQPEVLYNSNSVDFKVEDANGISIDESKNENYQSIDLPVMLGSALGPLRIGAGPVWHLFVKSSSELLEFEKISHDFESITTGFQAGIGLDLWTAHIDVRYEGNFKRFGNHLLWDGVRHRFNSSPTRLLLSLGITF